MERKKDKCSAVALPRIATGNDFGRKNRAQSPPPSLRSTASCDAGRHDVSWNGLLLDQWTLGNLAQIYIYRLQVPRLHAYSIGASTDVDPLQVVKPFAKKLNYPG